MISLPAWPRSITAVFAIIVILLLTTGLPGGVGGSSFDYSIDYELDGEIEVRRRVGMEGVTAEEETFFQRIHTGAIKEQVISGDAKLKRKETIRIADNIIMTDEENSWLVSAEASDNLIMITTVRLAAKPMTTVAAEYYNDDYYFREGRIVSPYHPVVVDLVQAGYLELSPMTRQLWAAGIVTEPGHEGAYDLDMVAAYGFGPYEKRGIIDPITGELVQQDKDYMWWPEEGHPENIFRGDRYVGNYFRAEQYSYTSGGEMRRLIDISNPLDNSYYREEFMVLGMAEVREAFDMMILPPGPDAVTFEWYDLF